MVEQKKEIDGVIYRKSTPVDCKERGYNSHWKGFKTEEVHYKKGWVGKKWKKPLDCDILLEKDTPIKMRDGITIYADIYRPEHAGQVPVIVAWGPYGKSGGGYNQIPEMPGRLGIPKDALSDLVSFEAPDPDFWCSKGYAVCNPDPRGVFMSEGNIQFWGEQEAQDAYDTIEWLAEQKWCSGKVGMSGNSWLAITQLHTAAQRPPHLYAIAPWEACGRMYADDVCRGGIPDTNFCDSICHGLYGNNWTEDAPAMVEAHPLYDEYWKGKMADFSKIEIPAYFVASLAGVPHCNGTYYAFEHIGSEEKWLRVHNNLEWTDYYQKSSMEDLLKFFDHYLKDKNNGWEKTEKVRMTVLDFEREDIVGRPEDAFPPSRVQNRKMFLNAENGKLEEKLPVKESVISYQSDDRTGQTTFRYTFDRDQELIGFPRVKLWMNTDEAKDMDIFVHICKYDAKGKKMLHHQVRPKQFPWKYIYPKINGRATTYMGPDGRLRASLRAYNPETLDDHFMEYPFDHHEYLNPGEIVDVIIPVWPISMKFHKGETLELVISGYYLPKPPLPTVKPVQANNKGKHYVHTGGQYDSWLSLPFAD